MTPTEYLLLEVMAARYRLDQKTWTFPTDAAKASVLVSLERQGYILWKYGVIEKTVLVWLTDFGIQSCGLDKADPNKIIA
jgi:hypothetical protein